jgi:glycosyltransferase involved in cell wall biosynthesis
MMHLGVDATNISSGGGLTHLVRLLYAADPAKVAIDKITIWTSSQTAQHLPNRPWLELVTPTWCNGSILSRALGQQLLIPKYLQAAGCDVLFSPGGTLSWRSLVPMVTMSQNMLPFEPSKADLFGRWSRMRTKIRLLRLSQGTSFLRAQGLIFLTDYARTVVTDVLKGVSAQTALIPHGIEERFVQVPRRQRSFEEFSAKNPLKILYVSILMPYKHQMEVAQAVAKLRALGFPVEVRFVGTPWGSYGHAFRRLLKELDPEDTFLHFAGHVPFESLHELYKNADVFLFASSCENLPNILIEAMAAGLPVLSSDRGPMPEVLGDTGLYFNPESPESIAEAIMTSAKNAELRERLAQAAWLKAQSYSWEQCANETLSFIAHVARQHIG